MRPQGNGETVWNKNACWRFMMRMRTGYRVALGYLRSAHDAEDAVQAVFCRLLEKELTIWPGRERARF